MFSFPTSKPLVLALIISLSINGLLFGVSKHLYDAKAEAVGQVGFLKQTLSDQIIASNKADSACVISHSLVSEYQEEREALESVEREALEEVDKLANAQPRVSTPQEDKGNVQKDSVVPLDGRLPDELVSLLKQTYYSIQRQGTHHP